MKFSEIKVYVMLNGGLIDVTLKPIMNWCQASAIEDGEHAALSQKL